MRRISLLALFLIACMPCVLKAQDEGMKIASLRLAIQDLMTTFGDRYPQGADYLRQLDRIEAALSDASNQGARATAVQDYPKLARDALMDNPLLDFDKLLMVRRPMRSHKVGLFQNWQANSAIGDGNSFDDEISILSPVGPQGVRTTLFKPAMKTIVSDVDLHFDADRLMFSSMREGNRRWEVFEIRADGTGLRQVTVEDPANDYDNYDSCYLPDGRIIFASTRVFQGVPCVGGGDPVANLFIMDSDGGNVRRLTFDQDQCWYPTVMNNGRVMFTRWEYSDAAHYFSRIVMHMNPDGTGQVALYGSNSYWPNSTFFCRPIPNESSKFVGIVSGHHGVGRMGELVLFDPARGRQEADGAVQRIPGYGKKVNPVMGDSIVNDSWPKFIHPYPLSDKYFLVSAMKKDSKSWGIYLVDVFDNMLLLHEEDGWAMMEPIPFRKTPTPHVLPDRVDLAKKTAAMMITDIYMGDGLKGVPRGTVKELCIYEVHYSYNGMGGHRDVGIDGPWDVRRIIGRVPVYPDGSAHFTIPANTPLALMPLDSEGKALQLMRSWTVGMPGERVSCVGCHESQNASVPSKAAIAMTKPPSPITPWYGPARGFSFKREVQPVLDAYCIACHNGEPKNGKTLPNYRRDQKAQQSVGPWTNQRIIAGQFTPSYQQLHPYVYRSGPEGDMHMLTPMEYHADASELVQMLRKGHHGVTLDTEAWSRLITWIDLNVPDHGTWSEQRGIRGNLRARRAEVQSRFAGIDSDPELIDPVPTNAITPVMPAPVVKPTTAVTAAGWPFSSEEAKRRQDEAAQATHDAKPTLRVDVEDGVALEMVLVPAGEFVMGDIEGEADEWPLARVDVAKPFWIGKFEISNEQFRKFEAEHDSGYVYVFAKDHSNPGIGINGDKQPAVRMSWQKAMAFCEWLSRKTGRTFSLPTEAQWEYACRAGTDSPVSYGMRDDDFSRHANFADRQINGIRTEGQWIPRIDSVDDGATVTTDIGRYKPNAWGIHDMHGNVSEWTATTYRPYPYKSDGDRDKISPEGRKVVRGGSFYDRPKRGRSAFRLDFESWQAVHNVGFRVVCEVEAPDVRPCQRRW